MPQCRARGSSDEEHIRSLSDAQNQINNLLQAQTEAHSKSSTRCPSRLFHATFVAIFHFLRTTS
jgi:hypothetical protein